MALRETLNNIMDTQTSVAIGNILTTHDPFFTVIKREKFSRNIFNDIVFLSCLACFAGLLALVTGMFSVFYPHKQHLQIGGIAGLFHIFGLVFCELSVRKRNRYLLLGTVYMNLAFMMVALIFLTIFIGVGELPGRAI